jgi:hypothetical protein
MPESFITRTSRSPSGIFWINALSTARDKEERPMVGIIVEQKIFGLFDIRSSVLFMRFAIIYDFL